MRVVFADFNGFEDAAKPAVLGELVAVLKSVPLHVKASDQAGKVGELIFDPVGMNDAIKSGLQARDWAANIAIPKAHSQLGTDVDYGRAGLLAEGQFSNYPFFLNNLLRTNFFFKRGVEFGVLGKVQAAVIVTKGRMFPASNSTLYYEQAVGQMNFMIETGVLSVPIRLIGLTEELNTTIRAIRTTYHQPRYSRTVVTREEIACQLRPGRTADARCKVQL
jgi:hypothetical protein